MWHFVKCHPRSAAWVVAIWMATVILLLLVGPVIHL
jgi:cytochrome c-type biogenesis protein CcmH/NrfF